MRNTFRGYTYLMALGERISSLSAKMNFWLRSEVFEKVIIQAAGD